MASITSVESLFLEDLGVLGINKLTASGSDETRGGDKSEHDDDDDDTGQFSDTSS